METAALAQIAAVVAAVIGLGLGVLGLVAPMQAAKIVRLQADPAFPDGVAEFRASFGGLFVAVHGLALGFVAFEVAHRAFPVASTIAFATAAALWLGTAFGRLIAILLDRAARTAYQTFAVVFEVVLGLALAAPAATSLILIYF